MSADYYNILNVHPDAEEEVIEAAFKVLVKKHRDDKYLRQFTEAHSVLCDKKKRKEYDVSRKKPTGKVVGEYRIRSKIAEGGFGITYLGEHLTTGAPVCIKHAINIGPTDEALLLEEARSIWDLRHFGIPAVRDVLRMPDGSIALVMSYVPGMTLAQIRENNYPDGIDAEHVAWITQRILNILKYLHMHGVVHGDVKPQNIIVQAESHTVVLVDYGLAALKPSAKSEAKGYTPFFAAPELIDSKPPLPESDFYGLGMTMVYALGGDVEFVKVPSSTPDHMCAFIKRLIRRDALARPNWKNEDLEKTIEEVRQKDFRRTNSAMKPLKVT